MHRIITALAFTALLTAGASAQQAQPTPADIAAQVSMRGYGDREKTCAEWTDSCMTCTRAENGDPRCSNIGIACQPKEILCTRKMPDPAAPAPASAPTPTPAPAPPSAPAKQN